MSLNNLTLTPQRTFDLQPSERILTPRSGYTADVELKIPPTLAGQKRTENASGFIWVTDQRIVFATSPSTPQDTSAPPSYDKGAGLRSLTIPYATLLSSTFHLPTFSANNILLKFLPDPTLGPGSNLPSPGRGAHLEFKIIVGEGGLHALFKIIEGERSRAERERKEGEMLPAYTAEASEVAPL